LGHRMSLDYGESIKVEEFGRLKITGNLRNKFDFISSFAVDSITKLHAVCGGNSVYSYDIHK
jgi:hypothetical protein